MLQEMCDMFYNLRLRFYFYDCDIDFRSTFLSFDVYRFRFKNIFFFDVNFVLFRPLSYENSIF